MVATAVDEALNAVRAAVDGLLELELTRLASVDVAGVISELEVQRRRLDAVDVRVVGEAVGRGLAAEFCAASPADLLTSLTRCTRREARARWQRSIDLGARQAVSGEALEPIQPRTADALHAGEISAAHVDEITRVLGKIPASAKAEAFGIAESYLVEAARHEDPVGVRQSGALLLARLDPDGQEPRDEEKQRQRGYSLAGLTGGGSSPRGRFTDECTAIWRTILDALSAPQPGPDGEKDPRTATQRGHDAMVEAGLRLLSSGSLPDTGGTPVTVLVRTTAEDLAKIENGEPGAVAVTEHGDLISLDLILRLGGDAELHEVVCAAAGGVLDYGRTRRLASCGQRRALAARDGGCCFPGCTRPASWTEVHHVIAWRNGGHTSLDNMVLLCPYHHRHHEAAGWTIDMTSGSPLWIPPAWLDPSRRPRRNTAHHLPDITFDTDTVPSYPSRELTRAWRRD